MDERQYQVATPKLDEWHLSSDIAKKQFVDIDLARSRASRIRNQVIHNLGEHLKEFDTKFLHAGGKVIWAPERDDAVKSVIDIIEQNKAEVVVKTHSTESYELGLNQEIRNLGNTVYETDFGDFAVDLTDKLPSHPRMPDLHLSREESLQILKTKLSIEEDSKESETLHQWKILMRKKHVAAGVSIVGAEFLISSMGSVVLTSREDNVLLSVLKSPVLIVLAGIEKFLPSLNELSLMLSLLGTHAYGQRFPEKVQVLTGNGRDVSNHRREVYVILIDNGRSKVLADEKMRSILKCIHCGACSNVCPVFKTLGGHAYGTVYPGPFGSIFEAHRVGMGKFHHLSKASTLCGECTKICPVNIDLQRLLIHTRKMAVEDKLVPRKEKSGYRKFKNILSEGGRADKFPKWLKQLYLNKLHSKSDKGKSMEWPFAEQSFHKLWDKEGHNL